MPGRNSVEELYRFGCIQDSRAFCQTFFPWYNDDHRHSGIGMMTPAMVHYGLAAAVRGISKWPMLWPAVPKNRN
jgi:hypothetical protein